MVSPSRFPLDLSKSIRRAGLLNGFTLIEVLITIGIIAVLAVLIVPVMGIAKEKKNTTTCVSTMRQLMIASQMYSDDHDNYIVQAYNSGGRSWLYELAPYRDAEQTSPWDSLFCPADTRPARPFHGDAKAVWGSYQINTTIAGYVSLWRTKLVNISTPSARILFMDAANRYENPVGHSWPPSASSISFRHRGKAVFGYLDGHVSVQGLDDIKREDFLRN